MEWTKVQHDGWIPEEEWNKNMGDNSIYQPIGKFQYLSEAGSIVKLRDLWKATYYWEFCESGGEGELYRFKALKDAKAFAEMKYKQI